MPGADLWITQKREMVSKSPQRDWAKAEKGDKKSYKNEYHPCMRHEAQNWKDQYNARN
jgi:hypothetical protein